MTSFIGTITDAEGGLMYLTVVGPNHYLFNRSYANSFTEKLNLSAGDYTVTISAATTGNFSFNVSGSVKSIDPKVPDQFNNTMRMYDLMVGER